MNNRTILVPAQPGSQARAELMDWLGINSGREDGLLERQILAAIEACEGFTGQMPLTQTCEEILPVSGSFVSLATRPVANLIGVEGMAADGTRTALSADDYAFELSADGSAKIRIIRPGTAARIAVQFSAGLADDWQGLPSAIRHGIERLAAHGYRTRSGEERDSDLPPAAVAALWRPFRRMRLA